MAKSKLKKKYNAPELENKTRHILMNKFYNIYMNRVEFKGLTHEEEDYILRKLWTEGTISAFSMDNVGVVFSPYAPESWGLYDVPVNLNFINERNVPGYKQKGRNGVDCCIGFYNRSHKPVKQIVEYYVNRMVDILMSIYVNTQTSKLPFIIATSNENIDAINDSIDNIYNNELAIFMTAELTDNIQVSNAGNNYIIDKLWVQYQNYVGECLTELGIDNNPLSIERITADQANANNDLLNIVDEGITYELKAFFEKVEELFGKHVEVISKHTEADSVHDEEGDNKEEDNKEEE